MSITDFYAIFLVPSSLSPSSAPQIAPSSLSVPCFVLLSLSLLLAVEAKRCGHSELMNNRPFMMPRDAMMILLCPPPPPPPNPHPAPASTAAQECGPTSYPLRRHHHHLTSAAAVATEAPLLPNKKSQRRQETIVGGWVVVVVVGGGGLCRRSTKRGFMVGHIHSQRKKKKEGHPFKCGAAALI